MRLRFRRPRLKRLIICLLALFLTAFIFPVHMKSIYPGQGAQSGLFLVQDTPAYQVLWYEAQDAWSWLQYNSAPYERCHFDRLSWWDDGWLRYDWTHNGCGLVVEDTLYNPPLLFMPEWWDGQYWQYGSQSAVTTYRDNVLDCTGTNTYTNRLWPETGSGLNVIKFMTEQTTVWNNVGSCAGWNATQWQEVYTFVEALPVEGGAATLPGLWKSRGDVLIDEEWHSLWNITYNHWEALP